jgi:hypothetical protein
LVIPRGCIEVGIIIVGGGDFTKDGLTDVLAGEDSCSSSLADASTAQMPAIVWGALACLAAAALSTGELFMEDSPVALLFSVQSTGLFLFTCDVCNAPPLFFHNT